MITYPKTCYSLIKYVYAISTKMDQFKTVMLAQRKCIKVAIGLNNDCSPVEQDKHKGHPYNLFPPKAGIDCHYLWQAVSPRTRFVFN